MYRINKVMLIDDSTAVNNINQNLLKGTGYFKEILCYTDPKKAIESLRNYFTEKDSLPELIFLDINMPNMDGFDFLEEYIQLKNIADTKYAPVIVIVSDHLDYENFTKSKYYTSYGVLDHVKKPLEKDDITEIVNEHLSDV